MTLLTPSAIVPNLSQRQPGRTVSYAVILLNERDDVLLAHATGTDYWDLPKGAGEPGELPRIAAVRETLEETGLVVDGDALIDLGQANYTARKDLHAFWGRTHSTAFELIDCVCTSFFPHERTGEMTPEMDGYVWASQSMLYQLCTDNMFRYLTKQLGLVKERLTEEAWKRTISVRIG